MIVMLSLGSSAKTADHAILMAIMAQLKKTQGVAAMPRCIKKNSVNLRNLA
jgi:hypothetical protein